MKSTAFKELRVLAGKNNPPIRESRFAFSYESFRAAGLKRLRQRYDFDALSASATSDWELMCALRDWLSARWDHGYDNTTKGDSPTGLEYLMRSEQGESFTCAIFAHTLVEMLTCVGIPARNLSIGRGSSDFIAPQDEVGHSICEAWSNHHRKWIVLDADAGAHYESQGVPLSALEIRQAWLDGRWQELNFVRAPRVPAIRYETFDGSRHQLAKEFQKFYRRNIIDFYENLVYPTTHRHFYRPRQARRLMWFDAGCPPRMVRHNVAVAPEDYTVTSRRDDVEHSLNHAFLRVFCAGRTDSKPSQTLQVHAETQTPWFSHYEVKIGDGAWRRAALPVTWKVQEGDNTVAVRPVNAFRRIGIESSLTLRMSRK